jgi:hypothetical protein
MSDQPDQNDQHNQHNQDERLDQPIHPPASPLIDHASLSVTEAHADPEDLVLYAMQFLNREQTSAVAAHVAACAECREELARVQGDLATTALTTELESPPASARQRLLAQIAREKKVTPIAQPTQIAPPAPPAEPPPPALAPFGRQGSILNPIEEIKPKRPFGLAIVGSIGWAIAAGLAFFAFTLHKDRDNLRGTIAARAGEVQRLTAEAAESHQLLDALTDPKAIRVSLTATPQPKPQPIGGVTYNPDKGTLVFLASNLDPLKAYKTYELWVIPADGTAPIPAGTFHPDDQGNASVIMPDLPKGIPAKAFGVTVEDDGGAQTPTLPIVLAGGLG